MAGDIRNSDTGHPESLSSDPLMPTTVEQMNLDTVSQGVTESLTSDHHLYTAVELGNLDSVSKGDSVLKENGTADVTLSLPVPITSTESYMASLRYAMRRRNFSLFQNIISTFCHQYSQSYHNLLYDACEEGLAQYVEELLRIGADPTDYCDGKEEKYAILVTARKGYVNVLDLLMQNMLENGKLYEGLMQRNNWGNSVFHNIIKSIKDKNNPIVDHRNCLEIILKFREYFSDRLIRKEDYNLICDACEEGLVDFIQELLENNDDTNHGNENMNNISIDPTEYYRKKDHKYPHHLAGYKGNYTILELVLKKIKSINKLEMAIQQKDKWGNTVLHNIAIGLEKAKKKSVKGKSHFSIDMKNSFIKCVEIVMHYCRQYIDINAVNNKGNTVFDIASHINEDEEHTYANILIKNGASPKIKNKDTFLVPRNRASSKDVLNDTYDYSELNSKKKSSENLLLEAFENGYYNIVHPLVENLVWTKKHLSSEQIKSIINDILRGYVSVQEETNSRHEYSRPNILDYQSKEGLEGKIDYGKCMDILLKNNDHFNTVSIIEKNGLLYEVCDKGQFVFVEKFLTYGCDPSRCEDVLEKTPIEAAFYNGYYKIVELLIQKLDKNQQERWIKNIFENILKGRKRINENEDMRYQKTISTNLNYLNREVEHSKCLSILLDNIKCECLLKDCDIFYEVCDKGLQDLLKVLLEHDVPLHCGDTMSLYPMAVSCNKGYFTIVEMIMLYMKDKGAEITNDWIKYTIKCILGGKREQWENFNKEYENIKYKRKSKIYAKNSHSDTNYEKCLKIILENINDDGVTRDPKLFYDMCDYGFEEFVEIFLEYGANPNLYVENTDANYPLIIAASKGYCKIVHLLVSYMKHWGILEGLQNKTDKNGQNAIHSILWTLLQKRKIKKGFGVNYMSCMDIILKHKQYFDIDAVDFNDNTAVHYAIRMRGEQNFTKMLLENGASVNISSKSGVLCTHKINPSIMKEVLDGCIEVRGTNKVDSELKLNFSIFSHHHNSMGSETDLISAIWRSDPHKHLVQHPVISTFLYIKWQKLKWLWYFMLLFTFVFHILLLSYVIIFHKAKDEYLKDASGFSVFWIALFTMSMFLLLIEMLSIYTFRMIYLLSFETWHQILILVLVIAYAKQLPSQMFLSISVVILSITKLVLYFEKFPFSLLSPYIFLLRQVIQKFIQLFFIFIWLFIMFGISFYFLLHENISILEDKNDLQSAAQVFVTTLFMSTGNLEYFDSAVSEFSVTSIFLCVAFVFIIVLVVMNWLNAIAVNIVSEMKKSSITHLSVDNIIIMDRLLLNFCKLVRLNLFWKQTLILKDCFPEKNLLTLYPDRHFSKMNICCKGHKCVNFDPENCFKFKCERLYKKFILIFSKCFNSRKSFIKNRCEICSEKRKTSKLNHYFHKCLHRHSFKINISSVKEMLKINKHDKNKDIVL
ncbi:unnamed protein product [Meganyctiphanes norvegica]|uniref:Ion transport domain-containing protein n=1 Tax=Meganyctiphanes norvegica TaxID=48144 RepID=A0AAV2RJD0_MEGNR